MRTAALAYDGPRQLSLDFGGVAEEPQAIPTWDNVYFAVLPDPDVARRMTEVGAELRRRHDLPGRLHPARLLHVSLAAIGNKYGLSQRDVAAAIRAGAAIRTAPFDVSFDHAMSFDNEHRWPLVLRCRTGDAGFARLRKTIVAALARAGLRPDRSTGLAPHVTLIYQGRPVPDTALPMPITWTVRELVLVHSLHGYGRHVHLGRWPLSG